MRIRILGCCSWRPVAASAQYNAPIIDSDPFPGAPAITSTWFAATAPAQYPRDVAAGGEPTGHFLGVFPRIFYWRGTFKYAPAVGSDAITRQRAEPTAMAILPVGGWF